MLRDIELQNLAKKLRKRTIKVSHKAKIPHLGSCLSCIDILVYLYWCVLKINPDDPNNEDRDRFLLSKGHGAPALFQVLAEKGFFSIKDLNEFGKQGSVFHEHPPVPGYINGVEAATGSLGHGLPMGLGMAISAKIQGKDFKTVVLLSDGECNEGSIWEAALLAPSLKVDNLIAIIDYNKIPKHKNWPTGIEWDEYYFFGGEDYELVFSLPRKWANNLLFADKTITEIDFDSSFDLLLNISTKLLIVKRRFFLSV